MASGLEVINDALCVVLVGGESRRMGRDKAQTPLSGKTLVERVLEVVRPLFSEVAIGAHEADYPAPEGIAVIADTMEGRGPALGICSALEYTEREWIFVVSCDLPFLAPGLISYLGGLREGADIVVPRTSDGVQTMCAFYSRRILPELSVRVRDGRRSLVSFFRESTGAVRIRYVEEDELRRADPELGSFKDVDTPEELDRASEVIEERDKG